MFQYLFLLVSTVLQYGSYAVAMLITKGTATAVIFIFMDLYRTKQAGIQVCYWVIDLLFRSRELRTDLWFQACALLAPLLVWKSKSLLVPCNLCCGKRKARTVYRKHLVYTNMWREEPVKGVLAYFVGLVLRGNKEAVVKFNFHVTPTNPGDEGEIEVRLMPIQ